MDAGQVVAIGVPDSPSAGFRVKWRIDADLRGLVRTDSVVTIGTQGVVGDTDLSVGPGSARAQEAAALATIPSREPIELSELLAGGARLLTEAQGTMKEMSAKLGVALDTITSTVSNANDVVVGLKQGRGAAGMLLSDDALAGRIREAVKNAEQATTYLGHASSQADALVTDLNSRQIPQKAGEVVDNLRVATDNLSESSKQVRQVVSEIAQPDRRGTSVGTNITESLMQANIATSNLAEGTEALKHNFLVRGYFKKRGYYNLADLSPATYRRERAFASQGHHRVWLSGSELFKMARTEMRSCRRTESRS
jgi:phospholipid/cholesterol/gamma-HCH transport system substrate-binding protein